MANPEHVSMLKNGVSEWNKWRTDHQEIRPDLSSADLRNMDLREANLYQVDFYQADLRGTDFRGANLREAFLSHVWLDGANMSHARLYKATLVESSLKGTDLRGARIYGASVWNVELDGQSKQDGLIITLPEEATITVDDLEIAQFIYLLLNREKFRNAINGVTRKGVLLLGRFGGGGLEVLEAIAVRLRELDYLPIIFDFERPQNRNYTETVRTLAGLARFVIVDLSGPSVPQELTATVPDYKIPFVPILQVGQTSWSMVIDLFEYDHFIRPPVSFATKEEIVALLPEKVVAPAEAKLETRKALLQQLFVTGS